MAVILASISSIVIIVFCAIQIIRALSIAYNRKEINRKQFIGYGMITTSIGIVIAVMIPFSYHTIFELVFQQLL
jgi:hypothetical protein